MKRVFALSIIIVITTLILGNAQLKENSNLENYLSDVFDSTDAKLESIIIHIELNSLKNSNALQEILEQQLKSLDADIVIGKNSENIKSIDVTIKDKDDLNYCTAFSI